MLFPLCRFHSAVCSEEPNSTMPFFFTSPWCVENVSKNPSESGRSLCENKKKNIRSSYRNPRLQRFFPIFPQHLERIRRIWVFFFSKKNRSSKFPIFIKSKELNGAVNDNMTFPNWIVSCFSAGQGKTLSLGSSQFRIRLLGSNPDPFKSGYCLFWWSKKHPSASYRLSNPCHFFKFAKCFTAKSRTLPREVTVNL